VAERLSLHDVDDGVAFVAAITNRTGLELSWSEREDLEAYLVSTLWEISLVYEPGRIRKGFSTWAGIVLRRRVVDWQRAKGGRTKWQFKDRVYERQLPSFVSIDDQFDSDLLGSALGTDGGDDEANRDAPGGGLLGDRDRSRARDLETLGHGEA
jgi:hypothetical protein